jgi:tetrahydromethanopterin S-methyltransferase subunit G
MGNSAQQTVNEIEETREDLARKVDLLVDQAKIEAKAVGKKLAIAGVVVVGLLIVGLIAKKRVE